MAVALVAIGLATVLVPWVLRPWLWHRYQAGQMTGRRAGWIYGAAAAAPYLLLVAIVGLRDIGSLWIMILLMVLTLPVLIIPYVAMFRYPHDK